MSKTESQRLKEISQVAELVRKLSPSSLVLGPLFDLVNFTVPPFANVNTLLGNLFQEMVKNVCRCYYNFDENLTFVNSM